jgi:hypothetical protein
MDIDPIDSFPLELHDGGLPVLVLAWGCDDDRGRSQKLFDRKITTRCFIL